MTAFEIIGYSLAFALGIIFSVLVVLVGVGLYRVHQFNRRYDIDR